MRENGIEPNLRTSNALVSLVFRQSMYFEVIDSCRFRPYFVTYNRHD